jgi:gamma-glutamylcyclotransferase (GGCT)/AIG2-like uncharacterized protein YtfP
MPQHLFVYGTLRSEFPHTLALKLKSQAKLVGLGSAPGALYDFGWYPGAVFKADARTRVLGEVYALKNAERLLAQLDYYEGTTEPSNPFRRVAIKVRLERGGTVDAWTYEMVEPPARQRLIESGDFILHHRRTRQRPFRLWASADICVGRSGPLKGSRWKRQ